MDGSHQVIDAGRIAASIPKVIWIELTSKCPFDCVFCSRKLLRGDGQHMDFALYESLIASLQRPEIIRLNYSGESAHYPHLGEAIRLAKSTGAVTELVSALASIPVDKLRDLLLSGLDRLTVSVHTLDPQGFQQIYRFSSLDAMRERLAQFLAMRRELNARTRLDFAFVATHDNVQDLPALAAYALETGVSEIFVHPVLKRDPIAADFSAETDGTHLTADFRRELAAAVEAAGRAAPNVRVMIANPSAEGESHDLSFTPRYYPGPLPAGARIATCDQNPWETVHVLANGDVVVCEVQDKVALGNLGCQSLEEVWNGPAYRDFRRRYSAGDPAPCRDCPWKMAYRPAPLEARVSAALGGAQLARGWHDREENIVWSKGDSLLILDGGRGGGRLHLSGVLPAAAGGNVLRVQRGGQTIGEVVNDSAHDHVFDASFLLDTPAGEPLYLTLKTREVFSPQARGTGSDGRVLGFALSFAELS